MTHIDFYILATEAPMAQWRMAARLCDKAYRQRQQVYIHTEAAAHSKQLDELLWTQSAESFLPHGLMGEETDAPILIGHAAEADPSADVLINLDQQVPLFFSQFGRVIEIVPQESELRQQVRQHYRFYKDRGYVVKTHDISHAQFR